MTAAGDGYERRMNPEDQPDQQARTVAAMHDSADGLHVSAGTLHRSARQSPSEATTGRLHALGDDVTTQAHDIDRRADQLTGRAPRGEWIQLAGGHTGPPGAADQ